MKFKLTKAQAKAFAQGKVVKAGDQEIKPGDQLAVTKDASSAIRVARRAARKSEADVAEALGLSEDEYIAFEQDGAPLELNGAGIKALAKTLKVPVEDLAASMLAGDPAAAEDDSEDDTSDTGDTGDGDPVAPEKKAKATVKKNDTKRDLSPTFNFLTKADLEKALGNTGGVEKAAARESLVKSMLCIDQKVDLRKDLITPEMFAENSTLSYEQATDVISLVTEQNELLKKVQVRQMSAISQEVLVWNLAERTARRFASGAWPGTADLTEGVNKSLHLTAQKMNINFTIDDRTLLNYKGNLPGLEKFVLEGFSKALANQIVDLGINGTTDTYANSFLSLGTGWVALAQALAGNRAVPTAQIIDVSTGTTTTDTMIELFGVVRNAAVTNNAQYFSSTTPFIVGSTDLQRYKNEIGGRADATPFLISGTPPKYDGHDLFETPYLPTNTMLHTPFENLVVGILGGNGSDGIQIERFRVPQATLFVCTVYVDFEFVNPLAVCLAKP